jgi:hypothetical protein
VRARVLLVHIECRDLRAKFLFNFFEILKMFFFPMVGAYAPISRIEHKYIHNKGTISIGL